MDNRRFVVKFVQKALKEYNKLDGAIINEVDEALESLEERADEVGKPLGKKRQIDLTGTKEKKLRSSGIRIIYQITDRYVEVLRIVEVLLIDYKKDDLTIYREAAKRLQTQWRNDDGFWNPLEEDEITPDPISDIWEYFHELNEVEQRMIIDAFNNGNIDKAYHLFEHYRSLKGSG